MSSTLGTLITIVSVVGFIMGIFGNGFIVLINGIDWMRNRKISLIDFILIWLAISKICFLWIIVSFKVVYEKLFYFKNLIMGFSIFWTASNYSCIACTTCLSVFYFFKIANFSNPIFLWMKQRIHKVLLIIVLGTILFFCLSIIFSEILANNWIQECVKMEKNLTLNFRGTIYDHLTSYILYNMILIIFFIASLTCFLLLIFSLWSHTRQMELQGIYSRGTSTEAHIRAMKVMVSFLFLFIVYHFSNIMLILAYSVLDSIVAKIFTHVLIFLYPSGHPFLLILWNSKLKEASLCVLRRIKCLRAEVTPHPCNHT